MSANGKIYYQIDELSSAIQAHLILGTIPDKKPSTTISITTTAPLPSEAAPVVAAEVPKALNEDPKPPATKSAADTAVTAGASSEAAALPTSDDVTTTTKQYDRWTLLDNTTIEYGYSNRTGGAGIATLDDTSKSNTNYYYITTAINYTNGPAHMGHAYEAVTSDVIARYHRLVGTYPVYFVTGSDEHGQKIAQTAAADGNKEPIDICNLYVTGFQVLNQRIRITNDDYIRTTSQRHKQTAHALWIKCAEAGDIYLDTYSGWYNVREETFVPDNDALLANYIDPVSGVPLKKVEEESYFFRMSKYKDQLIKYIENDNPTFIQPEMHKNLILQRLKNDELRDLSISRTTFNWGIPVPEGYNANHVMYVWVDALSNYLTGVNALRAITPEYDTSANPNIDSLYKFWPASVHIIGKDILWFHTVIWPCLLMSAGVPLPRTVFAHGFVNDKDGKKMSKSVGNVIDPHDMLDKYTVDTFRWYLCKEAPYGGELAFSEDSMRDMHNADLCDNIGNLVHRAASLCLSNCNGVVPDVPAPTMNPPIPDIATVIETFIVKMNKFELQGGANIAIQTFRDINGYLQTEEPWKKKGDENTVVRQIIVRACLEAIYVAAHLLIPFLPESTGKIFQKLGTEPVSLVLLATTNCRNLQVGTSIVAGDVLYAKALSEDELKDNEAAAVKKKESFAEAQKRKKEAKEKIIAANKEKQAAAASSAEVDDPNQPDFTKIEIRVGKISKIWNHPDADKLFCEQIDLGEESGPREIASGLREHYTLEELQNRFVLVVCNLKAAKIVGFTSNGMVLAAKGEGKVELIDPPADAVIGERVTIDGITIADYEPATSAQVKKRKLWEMVAQNLITGPGGIATWAGKTIQTSTGPCKAASLEGAPIS